MPDMAMQHAECSRYTVPRACSHVHGGAGPTLRLDFQSASHACACRACIGWPRASGPQDIGLSGVKPRHLHRLSVSLAGTKAERLTVLFRYEKRG